MSSGSVPIPKTHELCAPGAVHRLTRRHADNVRRPIQANSEKSMSDRIDEVIRELEGVTQGTRTAFGSLSDDQLNWKPAATCSVATAYVDKTPPDMWRRS